MEYRGHASHPLLHNPSSHANHMFYYPGLPPGSKPPSGHLLPSVTPQSKHHRSGAPLPGGHTVPGPGPGGIATSQPPTSSGGRSFAAALRNLAKQAVPASERETEADSTPARQMSPKTRGPPPLVRGSSPTSGAPQDTRKEARSSARPEDVSLYPGRSNSGGPSEPPGAPQMMARSGFQPYRPEEARLGHPPPPPPFTLDPAAYSPYHHGLYPPHLQHAYRLEEQLYLERCGMLRAPLFPPLPPSYPLYGLRYSPDMLSAPLGLISPVMHERLKLEEEHRARETQRLRDEEKEREQERERDKERREKSRRSPRASPSHHQESPARKAPVTGVRERTADSRKEHPPPLIAPASIPTPTTVTLPPPLHPIPNPPLDAELQHSGKSLSRVSYACVSPLQPGHSISSHKAHTPPTHHLHPHPHMVSNHSHSRHHNNSASPHHPPSLPAPPPFTHSNTLTTSSQNTVPQHRTNNLPSLQARSGKEQPPHPTPAFVRPFEDSFPHQHSNRRSPIVARERPTNQDTMSDSKAPSHHHSLPQLPSQDNTPTPSSVPRKDTSVSHHKETASQIAKENSVKVTNSESVVQKSEASNGVDTGMEPQNHVPGGQSSLPYQVHQTNHTQLLHHQQPQQISHSVSHMASQQAYQPLSSSREQSYIPPSTNSREQFYQSPSNNREQPYQPFLGNREQYQHPSSNNREQYQPSQSNNREQYQSPSSNNREQSYQTSSTSREQLYKPPPGSQEHSYQPLPSNNREQSYQPLPSSNVEQSYQAVLPSNREQSYQSLPSSNREQLHQSQPASTREQPYQHPPPSNREQVYQHPPSSNREQSHQPPSSSNREQSFQPSSSSNREQSPHQPAASTNREQTYQPPTSSNREQSYHQSSVVLSSLVARVEQPSAAPTYHQPPAVLNVPDAAKVLAAVSAKDTTTTSMSVWDYHYLSRSIARSTETDTGSATAVSKLDLAEKRRREGRNAAVASDTDGEDSDVTMPVWITKGPPARLDISPKKLKFLRMFDLTTLSRRNELELRKLERRYARNTVHLRLDDTPTNVSNVPPALNLPVPRGCPDTLCGGPDYKSKLRFLKSLDLNSLPRKDREDFEHVWHTVMSDRLRRNCVSSVVVYCSRLESANATRNTNPNSKVLEDAAHHAHILLRQSDRLRGLCGVKRPLSPPADKLLVVPSSRQNGRTGLLLLQNGVKKMAMDHDDSDDEEHETRWPGLERVVGAYQRYSRERALEWSFLQDQCARLSQQLVDHRREADTLDRRLRELVARKNTQDYERHQTQQALDHLNACLRQLR